MAHGQAVKLTAKAVERYRPGEKRRHIKDALTPGLYLRIEPTGRKAWYYRYGGQGARWMRLGSTDELDVSQARAKATEYRQAVRAGEDPAAERQRARAERRRTPTVADFVDEYIQRHAKPHKRTWNEDQRTLRNWVVPRIGRLKVDEVHRRDVTAVLDACRDAGHRRMPGKVLAVMRRMFRFAVERGVIETTPVQYITERQPESTPRAMQAETVRAWWEATGRTIVAEVPEEPKPVALALRLLLLTGQRPGEVAGIRLDELDLDNEETGPAWTIPAERRKHGKAHAVALCPMAEAVVRQALDTVAAPGGEDGSPGLLFPNRAGGPCRVDSGLNRSLRLYFGQDGPTPHAARHTVATELEALGFDEQDIGRVLGHASTTVTGRVYINRRSLTAQRRILEAWEARLRQITGAGAADTE
ncbi:MAG: integrase family protein [Halorhodospira halophila]|uniref:tyrosine-type recombinase/integrase n=1 Tax=Halorhodospira halophila TaxID=1053 RepID=UPI0026F11435|nr:integrase family protein [Halorhodospira halophila]MCC3751767.1 integrase family protein [Halorhodospira halophila]